MTTTEKRPPPNGWTEFPAPDALRRQPGVTHTSVWESGKVFVISELAMMDAPRGDGQTLQWQVSVSHDGKRRPSDAQVEKVRRAFGMQEAEEDNHHPGVARHLFLCVDPARRVSCECKEGEAIVVEPDGYTWSNDPASCRECEHARLIGKACRAHGVRPLEAP